ncbi:fluoride efflux transporter FluC [Clostridium sp. JNZ X4-2]
MRKFIFIGIGGFLGAITRSFIKNIHIFNQTTIIPLDTLFINVTGSFILAFVLTVAVKKLKIDENIQLGISAGFVGAYTTFSTLCKETVNLITGKYYYAAASYMIMSAILGLAAVYLGIMAGNKLNLNITKNHHRPDYDEDVQDIDKVV